MSRGRRLDRLEAALPATGRQARLCRACGGLTGDVVLWAMDQGDAEAVALMDEATDTCERCGGKTWVGEMVEELASDPGSTD